MTKKSLFFSPSLQTATLAGIGFLSLATTFTAFTTISKNQTFSNYFESLNLNQKIKDFFPKASQGISSTFSKITLLWSQVTKKIPGFETLTNFISPVWEKTKTLFSGIIPGFKTIWSYMQQGWGYLGTAWKAVYDFLSNHMEWKYLLIFPGSIYLLIKHFPDISKTALEFIKNNLKNLWIFRWIFRTLKKWLGGPIETAKKWWNSLKITFYKLGYKWTSTLISSGKEKGWTEVTKYVKSWDIFQDTVSTILKFFKAYRSALKDISDENRKEIVEMFLTKPKDFIEKLKALMTEGKALRTDITKDNILDTLKQDLTALKATTTITEITEKVKEVGKEAIKNIASGIKNLVGSGSSGGDDKSSSEKAVEAASKATQTIWEKLLGIVSTVAKGAVEGVSSAIAGNSDASGSEEKVEE